jgi:hypothetical protein
MDVLLFSPRPAHFRSRNDCSVGAEGICEMRHLASFLRAGPSRIGRRLAQIVAIAAASLAAAGV